MKKKSLAILLPIGAGVALAGTGFGAWVFSNNVSSANKGANINVTAAINVSGLKVVFEDSYTDSEGKEYVGNTLTLDQNHDADMLLAYRFEALADDIAGVALTAQNSVPTDAQNISSLNSVTYNSAATPLDTNKTYTITYSCKYNFALSGAAATYLKDPDEDSSLTIGSSTDKKSMTFKYDTTKGDWIVTANDLTTVKTTTFEWNSTDVSTDTVKDNSAKPATVEEYNTMVAAFSNKNTAGSVILNLTDFVTYDVTCA